VNRVLNQLKRRFAQLRHRYMDGFIFIHINKTAGSSIEKALKIPSEHKTALEKIQQIGQKNWDKKFTFTVIRNPWDKVVSHYHYRVKTNQTDLGVNPVEFTKWVKLTYGDKNAFYYDNPKMFMPQVDWIADKNAKILVDKIIYFENLESDFNVVLQKLGRTITLPHVKKSNHGIYREYYDPETIEIVNNWFGRDIEIFGYHF
jgi:hypothetical protein